MASLKDDTLLHLLDAHAVVVDLDADGSMHRPETHLVSVGGDEASVAKFAEVKGDGCGRHSFREGPLDVCDGLGLGV